MSEPQPTIVVCGLGPATADLITTETAAAIERIPYRYIRTRRHPSAPALGDAIDFDDVYASAATIDEVYGRIVEMLVDGARQHGEILYAVPGSPIVAESTVERLSFDSRVAVELLPALSFLDLAWARLRIDPVNAGVGLVDGHRFEAEAAGERGPLLVAQCDSREVLSDVKLAIADHLADDGQVTVLQRLGLPDENIVALPWSELDREIEADHLTSVYIPQLAAPIAGEVAAFEQVVRRLRHDCPWDREQTHQTLRRHLLEEAYEVLEALDHLDVDAEEGFDALEEELGDLLFQIVFHSTLATEEGQFGLADVARGIREKLVGRHPHVFGDVEADTAEQVVANWEQIKRVEKGRASVMDGIPATLPALLYALKVQKRAGSAGVEWRSLLSDERSDDGDDDDGYGRRLLELVDAARLEGIDPETELRIATERVRDRFKDQEANRGPKDQPNGEPN